MTLNSCVYTVIVLLSISAFAWPLYIYFMFKWYKNHNHFVIRNRWPIISLAIITLAIIVQLLSIIEASLCITSLSAISIGITNAISGLVYYRAHLLYLQTLKAREYLNEMVPSKARHMLIASENKSFTVHEIWSKTILIIVFITSILIIILRYLEISNMYLLMVTQLIGIISVVNLLRGKVLDFIGIAKECICQISTAFIMLLFGAFAKSLVPTYIEIDLWAGFLTVTLYGFFVLFIPLHLIRKVKAKNNMINNNNTSTVPVKAISESIQMARQQGLSVISPTDRSDTLPGLRNTLSLNRSLRKPLAKFINDNIANYALFAGYLSQCFALENLLFLERAIILHHTIGKYQEMENGNLVSNGSNAKLFASKCYELEFSFLSQIYLDIEDMVEKNEVNEDNSDFMYQKGILEPMKMIYKQFCCRDSVTEINVSYGIIHNLQILFENKSDDQILNQFKSYNDMLLVFHFAIVECWNMCMSVYGFQFKSYLKKHSSSVVMTSKPKPKPKTPSKSEEIMYRD